MEEPEEKQNENPCDHHRHYPVRFTLHRVRRNDKIQLLAARLLGTHFHLDRIHEILRHLNQTFLLCGFPASRRFRHCISIYKYRLSNVTPFSALFKSAAAKKRNAAVRNDRGRN